ncbi:MAE_28990/MAE_18760 family HEPN-like nuclease [Rhodococcus sp. DMF-1]|uniref:MAE_28990/MAE_18760 family HEPN-like nuclease n=1 Tax=Rhodococcus sp. DMF-1 TaxID=2907624 RepID=UPI002279769C|nr:MAE_28990/MAE_18760 family HEPN-like nuclease [Rhodococcus sp. DMF-1]
MSASIRTAEQLFERISEDLSWRQREIFLFNSRMKGDEFERTLLRSSVALLYAHWEGFVKNACSYYLSYLASKRLSIQQLRPELAALALRRRIFEVSDTRKVQIQAEFVRDMRERSAERARIPTSGNAVRTESNLSSKVLTEILTSVGCDASRYEEFADLIDDQLVDARNKIAHGDESYIRRPEWDDLSKQVLWIMDDIATQLVNAAVLETYYAWRA